MKYLFTSVIILFQTAAFAQTLEAISQSYSFDISKEPSYCEKPIAPANLVFEKVDFQDANGNGIIEAGEACHLSFELVNLGRGHACRLELSIKESEASGIQISTPPALDELAPKDRKAFKIAIQGTMGQKSMPSNLLLTAVEKNGFDADPLKVTVNVLSFQEPKIELVDYKFSSAAESMKAGSEIELKVAVQNMGKGPAEKIEVKIKLPEANVFNAGEESFSIPKLGPGESKILDFQFMVNKKYNQPTLPCKLIATEKFGKYGQVKEISVAMNQTLATPQAVEVKPKEMPKTPDDLTPFSLNSEVDKNLPKTNMKRPDAVAVVIGNSRYTKTKMVNYAINDAASVRQYLIQVFGLEEGNIIFQTDARLEDFFDIFGRENGSGGKLAGKVKQGVSDVFVFYSGHGAPELGSKNENETFLVPITCHPNRVKEGGYSLKTLYQKLEDLKAKSITVVLDACFSGANLIEGASPMVLKPKYPTLQTAMVLASSQETEVSNWYDKEQHGMFTYFFLKAIQSPAKSDVNKDGLLTIEEIYNFVKHPNNGVPFYSKYQYGEAREQHPMLLGKEPGRVLVEYGK